MTQRLDKLTTDKVRGPNSNSSRMGPMPKRKINTVAQTKLGVYIPIWDSDSYPVYLSRTIRCSMVEYLIDILSKVTPKLIIYWKGSKKLVFMKEGNVVKMAMVYFVKNILCGRDYIKKISPWLWTPMEDLKEFNSFAWGKYVF